VKKPAYFLQLLVARCVQQVMKTNLAILAAVIFSIIALGISLVSLKREHMGPHHPPYASGWEERHGCQSDWKCGQSNPCEKQRRGKHHHHHKDRGMSKDQGQQNQNQPQPQH
jgi:hypothetical protein